MRAWREQMDHNTPDQGRQIPGTGKQGDRPHDEEKVGGQPTERSKADDRGTIPELPEPEVEGVGNEGRDNNLDQNRSEPSRA
jgi:hypothetical protein